MMVRPLSWLVAFDKLGDINAEHCRDTIERLCCDNHIRLIAKYTAKGADINLRLFLKAVLTIAVCVGNLLHFEANCHVSVVFLSIAIG